MFESRFEEVNFIEGGLFREFLDRFSKERDDKRLMRCSSKHSVDPGVCRIIFEWSERMAEKLSYTGEWRLPR